MCKPPRHRDLQAKVDQRLRWESLRAALERGFSDDFLAEGRQQPKDQSRPQLGCDNESV
jgi:antitoxin VapB